MIPSRWEYGRPWIQALNSGDRAGRRVPVDGAAAAASDGDPSRLTAAARARASNAHTPPSKSPTPSRSMGGHQVALVARLSRPAAGTRVQALEERRAESGCAVPRDDGGPRQDRRRRAARPRQDMAAISCCRTRWSSCWRAASDNGTPKPPPSICSSSRGGTAEPRTRRSSRGPATRFARGASREHRGPEGDIRHALAPCPVLYSWS